MWKRVYPFVLFIMVVSCSGDTDTVLLFQGDPGIHDLPAEVELEQILGGAPPVKFSTLQYENHILDKVSGKTNLPYISSVHLKAHDKQIAVTQTDYFISQPNGSFPKQVTDVDVGVPGIISLVYLTTKQTPSQPIQFRKLVRRFEKVNGRLFPLAKLNQLFFNVIFAYQVTHGKRHKPAQELMWSYRFRVIGHYEGYTLPNDTIPGKVYIIDRQEIDPEGSSDNTLIHFAESLGAVIKTVRQGKTFIEETRLVNMAAPITDP